MRNEQTRLTQCDWSVEGQFDAETSVVIVADHPKLGAVHVVEIEPLLGDWSDDEIANVRLMAAAPKLANAVNMICAAIHGAPDYALAEAINRAYNECRAALAKAEGRI